MSRKTTIAALFVGAMLALAPVALAGNDVATVSVTATVDSFAEWADASPEIVSGEWTGSTDGTTISVVGESLTVTEAMTLYANANVTLSTAGTTNDGIATNGSETLTTSYMITGDVGTPDVDYLAAGTGEGEFFEDGVNTYTVTHSPGDGSYAINLGAKVQSAASRAQDAGDYTCTLTLTATW